MALPEHRSAVVHQREMLVLANSPQHGHRCLVGVTHVGRLLRLVTRDGSPLPATARDFKPGTVIQFDDHGPHPNYYQPENHATSGRFLARPGWPTGATQRILDRLASDPAPLFGGQGKCVSPKQAAALRSSIRVVHPTQAAFYAKMAANHFQVRVRFTGPGGCFDLPVTDDHWTHTRMPRLACGEPPVALPIRYLLVSLGENFDGLHWKIVAGVHPHVPDPPLHPDR